MNNKVKAQRRIQFDFTPDALEQLNKLVFETNAASKAEVVRNALQLYEYTFEMIRDGFDLMFHKDEVTKTVKLLVNVKRYSNDGTTETAPINAKRKNVNKSGHRKKGDNIAKARRQKKIAV